MGELRLAANQVGFPGNQPYGHLQIVFRPDEGPLQELEVQAPSGVATALRGVKGVVSDKLFETKLGTWKYPPVRDHAGETGGKPNTPHLNDKDKYDFYSLSAADLDGRSPEAVWKILKQVHQQFAEDGARIPYILGETNSNSYITTLLSTVGVDVDDYAYRLAVSRVSNVPVEPPMVTAGLVPLTTKEIQPVSYPGLETNVLEDPGTAISLKLKGTGGVDFINTGAGADRVKGRGGDDEISTGLGNDIVTGGPGNDTIDGGNGFDKARFLHDRKDYLIRELGDGRVSVEDRSEEGGDGVDMLTSIEELVFADQTLDVEMRMASDPAYLARTAVVGGGSRSPEKVADAPEPKPEASPKPEPGPRPEPPASETVQDLGGDKPSGQDSSGDEKIDFAGLPPPPPPLPPGPPPSLLGSEPEPGPEPEPPVSDTVQDLGGNEPTGSNDEIFIA